MKALNDIKGWRNEFFYKPKCLNEKKAWIQNTILETKFLKKERTWNVKETNRCKALNLNLGINERK